MDPKGQPGPQGCPVLMESQAKRVQWVRPVREEKPDHRASRESRGSLVWLGPQGPLVLRERPAPLVIQVLKDPREHKARKARKAPREPKVFKVTLDHKDQPGRKARSDSKDYRARQGRMVETGKTDFKDLLGRWVRLDLKGPQVRKGHRVFQENKASREFQGR